MIFVYFTVWMCKRIVLDMKNQQHLYSEEYIEANKHGFNWPSIYEFQLTLISSVIIFILQHLIYAIVWNPLYHLCKEKNNEDLRIIKTDKAADKVYSFTYFIFSCVYGYLVLSKTEYLPFMLLGKKQNDLSSIWSDYPCIHKGDYLLSV